MEDKYIGMKFGRYTVLEKGGAYKGGSKLYICRCECGTIKKVSIDHLKRGRIKSCGCYNKETCARGHTKHGMCETRIYKIWCHMKERCFNKSCATYSGYGGRGIVVCQEWIDFISFYNWAIGHGYKDNLTIDRIDNDKNYSPDNCRWVTRSENCKRATQKLIEIDGIVKNISEWCTYSGASRKAVTRRMADGGVDAVKSYILSKMGGDVRVQFEFDRQKSVMGPNDMLDRIRALEAENKRLHKKIMQMGIAQ